MKTKLKKASKRKPAGRTRALAVDAGSASGISDGELNTMLHAVMLDKELDKLGAPKEQSGGKLSPFGRLRRVVEKLTAGWTKTPPTIQGEYWHWNGDEDSAPLPMFVLWSGTSGKCFVSRGQLGIENAVDCDEYGGWWMPLYAPPLPNNGHEPRAGDALTLKQKNIL